jgi:plastocyanin
MMDHRKSKVAVCTVGPLMLALIGFAALTERRAQAADQPPSNAEVKIDNFTFQAPSITITVGTQVTWINRDDMPHAIASDDKLFKSKALDTDEKFSFTFATPGTYHYFCSIHPKMIGEVIVK